MPAPSLGESGRGRGDAVLSHAVAGADRAVWPARELQRAADHIILSRFGPPGLIVDEWLNVLQSIGQITPLLDVAPGGVSWNLMRVLKEALAGKTREVVQQALLDNLPATGSAVLFDEEQGEQRLTIEVFPITGVSGWARCLLVLFQKVPAAEPTAQQPAPPHPAAADRERLVLQLRQDLNSARFHLQSLREERDTRSHELLGVNEEIRSANETLRGANEELQKAKEALQAANEELLSVNLQMQQRNNSLTQTGNDLTNLLNSVNIPLLMLDENLQIRQFTTPMQRMLSVRRSDIGRSINEIRLQLSVESIEPVLRDVLDSLATREMEVQDRDGRWFLLRVRPYRTVENKIEGLVVVLIDIDQLRRSQNLLMDAHQFASAVIDGVPVAVVVSNANGTIRTANSAFRRLADMEWRELQGRMLPDLLDRIWGLGQVKERFAEAFAGKQPLQCFEHISTTSRKRTLLFTCQVLTYGSEQALVVVVEDVTDLREAQNALAGKTESLQNEVELAAETLNRTREELRGLAAHLFTVQEEEREHVARELHDDISQRMALLDLLLNNARLSANDAADAEQFERAQNNLRTLNNDIRLISHRLHPAILKDLGLDAALRALVEEFGRNEDMPTTFLSQDVPDELPDATATALYRIAQEALRNVAKHAGRTHVKVLLQRTDADLELKVIDSGVGFDKQDEADARGLGMISMHERATIAEGTFRIDSALGLGTTVTVRIPL